MAVVSMKQLLEAGVHFGHQTRRWNPKMANFQESKRLYSKLLDKPLYHTRHLAFAARQITNVRPYFRYVRFFLSCLF